MPYFGIIAFVVIVAIYLSICFVEQSSVEVVEMFGKYRRLLSVGLNFKIPFLEIVAYKVSLRQQNFQLIGKYPSQDKVLVDVATNLIYVVNPVEVSILKYVYTLTDRRISIESIIENSLRTYIAKETHESILEKKEELASHISTDLSAQFEEWGMIIKSFQITSVNFPDKITEAMSEVVASQQLKKAAENKGEATKIQSIKEAEADKERKRLQGEGIALEREAIAQGLQKSVDIMQTITQQSPSEILAILTLTQYLDTMKTIGTSDNSKVIFMDSSVAKTGDIMKQIVASMESAK